MERKRQRDLALLPLGLDIRVEMAEQQTLPSLPEADAIAGSEFLWPA
jgi:hypothetical protein